MGAYPAYKKDYDAMVFIEGTDVVAISGDGETISHGTAGTDDATVIQAAIDASDSKTVVSYGVYTLHDKINVLKENYLIDFDGSTIIAGDNIANVDVNFLPDRLDNPHPLIQVAQSRNVTIENAVVNVNNKGGSIGIVVLGNGDFSGTWTCSNVTVRKCCVYNAADLDPPILYGGPTNRFGFGIACYGAVNTLIEDCETYSNSVGIRSYGWWSDGPDSSRGNTIRDCNVHDNNKRVVFWGGGGIHSSADPGLLIDSCKVYGEHTYGIWIGENVPNREFGVSVVNCRVTGTYNNGIHFAGESKYGRIIGNIVYECGAHGIAPGAGCLVMGNVCYDNGQRSMAGAGIYIYSGQGITVVGNTAYDSGAGTQVYGLNAIPSSAWPSKTKVSGNNFTGCSVPYLLIDAFDSLDETGFMGAISTDTYLKNSCTYEVGAASPVDLYLPENSWQHDTIKVYGVSSNLSDTQTIHAASGDVIYLDGISGSSLTMFRYSSLKMENKGYRYTRNYSLGFSTATTSNLNGGTVDWSSVGRVLLGDEKYSTATSTSDALTYRIVCKRNISSYIPSDATIIGITIDVQRMASHNDTNNYVVDNEVRLIKPDGSLTAENKADAVSKWSLPHNGYTYDRDWPVYGSSSDLWGETWGRADICNDEFGIVFAADIYSDGESVVAAVHRVALAVNFITGQNIWVAKIDFGNFEVV